MKPASLFPILKRSLLIATLLGLAQSVHAAGTSAGTDISSTATLNYQVNTVAQPAIQDAATFKVDRKIDMSVATTDGAAVAVRPGETKVLTFTVDNTGNSTIDVNLAATVIGTGNPAKFGGQNDAFDMQGVIVRVENGATAGYQAGEDTATFIDNLAADAQQTVYIVATAPAVGQADGDVSSYHLLAEAREPADTSALAETAGADNQLTVDTVFADGQGTDTANDVARDAKLSAQSDFESSNAVLSIGKASACIEDPFNGTTNPKAIPGATIKYTVTISNAAGGDTATLTTIADILNANVAIDTTAGTVTVTVTGGTRANKTPGPYTVGEAGVAHSDPANPGGTLTLTLTDLLPVDGGYAAGELKAGESVDVTYNVIVE